MYMDGITCVLLQMFIIGVIISDDFLVSTFLVHVQSIVNCLKS